MCKLCFSRTRDKTAYKTVVKMLQHQENTVAGHSTGIAWIDGQGTHLRKAVGKVINFLAEYPDQPSTNIALGHTRYATVGAITKENQHPIAVKLDGKRIGYAVHNGHWSAYKNYEYMRDESEENKTDSAVMFAIYSNILKKIGDSIPNRRIALATLQKFLSGKDSADQNIIIMFDNWQVIFSGYALSYQVKEGSMGVMTFGFDTKVKSDKIYEVRKNTIVELPFETTPYDLEAKPPTPTHYDYDFDDETCGVINPKAIIGDTRRIKGRTYKFWSEHKTVSEARRKGEAMKEAYTKNRQMLHYRILTDTGKVKLYIHEVITERMQPQRKLKDYGIDKVWDYDEFKRYGWGKI